VPGNELADELARNGSSSDFVGPEPFCRVPFSSVMNCVNSWERQNMLSYWNRVPGLRQSKRAIDPYRNCTTDMTKFGRQSLRRLISYLSGHCCLNYHLHKMNLIPDPECRLCRDDDETALHILCECEALCRLRLSYFKKPFLVADELRSISFKDILAFIVKAELIIN